MCIFAYGQTGSGKTHTMSGTDIGHYSGRGINFRALDDLFELNRVRTAEVRPARAALHAPWPAAAAAPAGFVPRAVPGLHARWQAGTAELSLATPPSSPPPRHTHALPAPPCPGLHPRPVPPPSPSCPRQVEYSISVQLLEIYNEAIRDLLVPDAEARAQRSLAIKNTERSGFNVPDAIQVGRAPPVGSFPHGQRALPPPATAAAPAPTSARPALPPIHAPPHQVPVACTEDVLEVMERGARNRAVAETRMNDRSSRSHQVRRCWLKRRRDGWQGALALQPCQQSGQRVGPASELRNVA